MTAIVAQDIVRTFGTGPGRVTALDGVSMSVGAGEVVGLVGANGAGKTTLIRVLLGLLAPDRGAVRLAGGRPSRETRRRVGYMPQGLGMWTDLTLGEHLELVGDVYGLDRAEPDGSLGQHADRVIGALPLGLRRRAAFTVALAHHPEVIVLDEPTSGVDPLARSRLWETIREVAARGAGVLVSTHYLDEAARCDRVVLLSDGRLVADGGVAELTRGRTAVRVSTPSWQEAWRRLEAASLEVLPAGRELRVAAATEDDVRRALDGLECQVATVPATLDEVFQQVTTH